MSTDQIKSITIVPTDIVGFSSLAERFSKSALIPQDLRAKPDDVFVTLLAGHELGLAPMASLRAIHVIKGKPVLSADTMVAIVLSSGAAEYFIPVGEATQTSATYETKRRGAPHPVQMTWTIEDAKRANLLSNDNWIKHPRSMLKARCKSQLARDVYPDALAGCYEEGEAEEIKSANPAPGPLPAILTKAQVAQAIPATAEDRPAEPPAPKTPADTWPACLADLAKLVDDPLAAHIGKPVSEWAADDVENAMALLLDACATAKECDAKLGPWGVALNKHGRPGSKAEALFAGFRTVFRKRRAELDKSEPAGAS